jgi:hypothetical protein
MKRTTYLVLLCLLVILAWFAFSEAFAQGEAGKNREGEAGVDKVKVETAVKRGIDFLKGKQQTNGRWVEEGSSAGYPEGVTALCLYALLEGGEPSDSECIRRGFGYLKEWWKSGRARKTYSVSCLILALCALYQPPPPEKEVEEMEQTKPGEKMRTGVFEPYEKKLKKGFEKNAPPWAKEWLENAVKWLLAQQQQNIWRYPGSQPNEDASNTQYAILALYTARSVGVNIPSGVFPKVAEYFIAAQEKDGPEVKPFPVPAADFDISQLKELEKEVLTDMKKLAEDYAREAEEARKKGTEPPKRDKISTTVEIPDPYKRFGVEPGKVKMRARGWSYYKVPAAPRNPADWVFRATGSMTTSGIMCLVVCKAEIEKSLNTKAKETLNQAIRDGMAWLAHNWSVYENPKNDRFKMYYLYGLERAGVLTLCSKMGEHNWYNEGAQHLLSAQMSDGSWPGDKVGANNTGFDYTEICSTCFAILFLKRSTVPVIRPPGYDEIYTGEGIFGSKEKSGKLETPKEGEEK